MGLRVRRVPSGVDVSAHPSAGPQPLGPGLPQASPLAPASPLPQPPLYLTWKGWWAQLPGEATPPSLQGPPVSSWGRTD